MLPSCKACANSRFPSAEVKAMQLGGSGRCGSHNDGGWWRCQARPRGSARVVSEMASPSAPPSPPYVRDQAVTDLVERFALQRRLDRFLGVMGDHGWLLQMLSEVVLMS